MNVDRLTKQSEILNALAADVLDGIPPNWTSATLTIDCDGTRIKYKLKNLIGEEGKATISNLLAKLSEELYFDSADRGEIWNEAVLTLTKKPDGDWRFSCDYSYAS